MMYNVLNQCISMVKPTLHWRCEPCQKYANLQHRPANQLTFIVAPWPFAQWGIDILGPFPPASGFWKYYNLIIDAC